MSPSFTNQDRQKRDTFRVFFRIITKLFKNTYWGYKKIIPFLDPQMAKFLSHFYEEFSTIRDKHPSHIFEVCLRYHERQELIFVINFNLPKISPIQQNIKEYDEEEYDEEEYDEEEYDEEEYDEEEYDDSFDKCNHLLKQNSKSIKNVYKHQTHIQMKSIGCLRKHSQRFTQMKKRNICRQYREELVVSNEKECIETGLIECPTCNIEQPKQNFTPWKYRYTYDYPKQYCATCYKKHVHTNSPNCSCCVCSYERKLKAVYERRKKGEKEIKKFVFTWEQFKNTYPIHPDDWEYYKEYYKYYCDIIYFYDDCSDDYSYDDYFYDDFYSYSIFMQKRLSMNKNYFKYLKFPIKQTRSSR